MNTGSVLAMFFIVVAVLTILGIQMTYTWPVVRPALKATWPMYPGAKEGFVGSESLKNTSSGLISRQGITTPALKAWLPSPESVTRQTQGGAESQIAPLEHAAPYEGLGNKPYKSYDLLPGGKPEPRVAGGPTSQKCYQVDWARGLERAGSYAQRTNNYIHGYPDSCSAPYHELILNFYEEKPMSAPYQV
jgi:hypothetical protein